MIRRKIGPIKSDNIRSMLKKPEVWVGLITMILIISLGINSLKGSVKKVLKSSTPSIISPEPSTEEISPKPSEKITPVKKEKVEKITPAPAKKEEKTITKFADTSSFYQVKEGDSYALISEKICGSQQWFEQIACENNYQELYPGDKITVNCGE